MYLRKYMLDMKTKNMKHITAPVKGGELRNCY